MYQLPQPSTHWSTASGSGVTTSSRSKRRCSTSTKGEPDMNWFKANAKLPKKAKDIVEEFVGSGQTETSSVAETLNDIASSFPDNYKARERRRALIDSAVEIR